MPVYAKPDHAPASSTVLGSRGDDLEEAVDVLGGHKEEGRVGRRFDLAVVDLDLPSGGGLELLEELHEAAPDVPVLGLTANGDRGLRARALGAGAGEVLVLSASGEEVVAAARRLGGWAAPSR